MSLIAKKVFNVPKVMARIYDEDKKPLLDKSGIETICPSILSEGLITKFMENKNEDCSPKRHGSKGYLDQALQRN